MLKRKRLKFEVIRERICRSIYDNQSIFVIVYLKEKKKKKVKKVAQKMLFWFTNISAKKLQLILGYNFCTEHHNLMNFCQMLLPLKELKIICAKAALL